MWESVPRGRCYSEIKKFKKNIIKDYDKTKSKASGEINTNKYIETEIFMQHH